MLAVVHRDAAFTGVVRKLAHGRPPVERLDGIGGQRPKAHARNIEQ